MKHSTTLPDLSAKKSKQYKKLLKHMLENHFTADSKSLKEFKLVAFKIYFTIEDLKNPYLAHFLIGDFIEHSQKQSFMYRNLKLVLQKYFECLINMHQLNKENMGEISL